MSRNLSKTLNILVYLCETAFFKRFMIINTDINILGGLPDINLINVFLEDTPAPLDSAGGHRSFTSIRTDRAVKRFESAIIGTILHYKNDEVKSMLTTCLRSEGITADSLHLLFLNSSRNNDLLHYLNKSVFFPALYSGRIGIKTEEVTACLNDLKSREPALQSWSDTTIKTTASKYLTLLKKFNLLEGSKNKSIKRIFLNDKVFVLYIYWLVAIEGAANLMKSDWLEYFYLDRDLFLERVMQKKYSKYYNLYYNGEQLRIEPIKSYQQIYHELTKS